MHPIKPQVMRTGVWSQDEHQRYIQAIRELSGEPWKTIAAFIGTRTERQVLSHHQKFVRKCKRFAVNPRALRAEHPVDFSVLPDPSGNQLELSEEEVAALTHAFINEWTPLDDSVKLEETPIPDTMHESSFADDFAAFDRYIQQILNARTLEELNAICGL